jgi:membrane glycosyltransferase
MGALAIVIRGELRAYGGAGALVRGTLLEGGLSMLQAPVRMAAHTLFVVAALTGLKLHWKSPPRTAQDVGWGHAARRFGMVGAAAAALTGWCLLAQPQAAVLLLPSGLPLMLAVPLIVLTSRATIGQRLLADRVLLTPEEYSVPPVLRFSRS